MALMNFEKQATGVVNTLDKRMGKLQKRSDTALQTFRDTLEELESVNTEIDAAVQVADTHMKSLAEKKEALLAHRSDNMRVSGKIKEFLGIE
jgi:predicted  nucleic acid-binding Zn-ribbon protein